jgi:hypothetical protein
VVYEIRREIPKAALAMADQQREPRSMRKADD